MPDPLDKLGRLIIQECRDKGIDFYDLLQEGKWKSEAMQQLHADLSTFSPQQAEVVRRVVVTTLDHAVHDLLFALATAHDFNQGVSVLVDGQDAVELSDGLHGEPYTAEGWIARFSRHPASV